MLNRRFSNITDFGNFIKLDMLCAYHCEVGEEWHFDNHCHSYNRLYVVLDGNGYLYNEKEHVDLELYNIYLIPANSSYNYRCDKYMQKLFIHFKLFIIPGTDILSSIEKIIKISVPKEEAERLKNICYCDNVTSALFFQSYILKIAAAALEPYSDKITRELKIYKKYESLFKYAEDNTYADTTVAEVCRHVGFSQTYISHKFKDDTGRSIKKLMTDMLLDKIKLMLQFESKTIKEIAEELRFNNEFYLSRFFKKHMGISPREYKKRHGAL